MLNWFAFVLGVIAGTAFSCLVGALCMAAGNAQAETDANTQGH